MVAVLLATDSSADAAQGLSSTQGDDTTRARTVPRVAERVHDDAPLVPPPDNSLAFTSARFPRSANRSPKTPPAIALATAEHHPTLFEL